MKRENTALDYEMLMPVLRKLALQAGEKILEIYETADFDVQHKSDDSPVTAADKAADKIIYDGLKAAFADIDIVTEEQAGSHTIKADQFLIVDPLDGTKEFINRNGDFTVNIALIEHGTPTRGIVYAPAKQRLFYTAPEGTAVEETGAFSQNVFGALRGISTAQPDNSALRVVASQSHRNAATDEYINKYNIGSIKPAGSSLKFCLIAAGDADLYPRLGPTMEWDTAAGHAVLSAAGGAVVRFDDHSPLSYGKGEYRNSHFIAHAAGVDLKL